MVQALLVVATESEITATFNEWLRQYQEDPEAFGDYDTPDYGEASKDCFVSILKEVQEKNEKEAK